MQFVMKRSHRRGRTRHSGRRTTKRLVIVIWVITLMAAALMIGWCPTYDISNAPLCAGLPHIQDFLRDSPREGENILQAWSGDGIHFSADQFSSHPEFRREAATALPGKHHELKKRLMKIG